MRRRIEQLEMELADSNDEKEQLNQRLSTTLSRINILKTTNQVCILFIVHFHSFFHLETNY
jgi:predicted RNase H-like nuclease (RuvC/YqgF family)